MGGGYTGGGYPGGGGGYPGGMGDYISPEHPPHAGVLDKGVIRTYKQLGRALDLITPIGGKEEAYYDMLKTFLDNEEVMTQILGTSFDASIFETRGSFAKALLEKCLQSEQVQQQPALMEAIRYMQEKIPLRGDGEEPTNLTGVARQDMRHLNLNEAFLAFDVQQLEQLVSRLPVLPATSSFIGPSVIRSRATGRGQLCKLQSSNERRGWLTVLSVLVQMGLSREYGDVKYFFAHFLRPEEHLREFDMFQYNTRGEVMRGLLEQLLSNNNVPQNTKFAVQAILPHVMMHGPGAQSAFIEESAQSEVGASP
uniref:Uncharacterized protein n=1 Tax=Timema cristinae TaxID=61476 RepID=A0A7R9DU95_TIMCR|nr:unnamed protein product [Timema cristinae]